MNRPAKTAQPPTLDLSTDTDAPACPKCGAADSLRFLEDITSARKVLRIERGALVVDSYYQTEGWDEDSTNPRLWCVGCAAEIPAPEGDALTFV